MPWNDPPSALFLAISVLPFVLVCIATFIQLEVSELNIIFKHVRDLIALSEDH